MVRVAVQHKVRFLPNNDVFINIPAHATVKPRSATLPHRFKTASEVYYILKGKGIMHIDEQSADVGPGETIYIPPMAVQYIENTGQENLEFLCIVYPSWQPDAEELV